MTFAIVYPPPPPTTNKLTSRQRTQLLRTTKKLERVLGAAPHLLDNRYGEDIRSQSPCSGYSTSSSRDSSPRRRLVRRGSISSTGSSASMRSSTPSPIDDDYKTKLPVLRLTAPCGLDSVPASPLSSPCSSEIDDYDTRFVLRPISDDVNEESFVPSFTIPTNNSLRRQKLDRLRRKLGDGVPLDLVFRHDDDEAQSESDTSPALSQHMSKALPPLPRSSERTISSARDSIVLMKTSPSRANKVKRKPVPKIVASRPAPPPPTNARITISSPASLKAKTRTRPSSTTSQAPKLPSSSSPSKLRDRARLSLILESPDEHGNTFIEEMEVSLVSGKWVPSGYELNDWFDVAKELDL